LKIPINIPDIGKEEIREVTAVLSEKSLTSSSFDGGKRVQQFEKLLSKFVKSKFAVAVNSGTAALQASLYAIDIKPGDEVLVPSFTFVATANSVKSVGAKPVFVDILKDNYTMDPDDLRKKITRRTKAIIPVHLYGHMAYMDEILEIAKKRNIKIIEDASQSLGSKLKGKHSGTFSHLGCFSLYGVKVITSGEGGAIVTDDKKLASFLTTNKEGKTFVPISTAEQLHAIDTITRFTSICSIVEVCKFQRNDKKSGLVFEDFKNLYLDDMINGLYDLRAIASSFEGVNSLMYLINGCLKGISSYIKRLIDIIRITLKKNDLKASRTKIVLSWTFDLNGMRGEKIEILDLLTSKLRDYIGDVETSQKPEDIFRSDKKTIVIVCSKYDYKKIKQNQRSEDFLVIKANSLCEVEQ